MEPLLVESRAYFKDANILGYEWVDDSHTKISKFLHNDVLIDKFQVILEDPVGSLIAIWETDNGELPVVYLNAEGSPFAVIANDFKEFLSLLHYGTYGVLEIEGYVNYQRSKSLYEKMQAKFTQEEPTGLSADEWENINTRLKNEFSNFDDVVSWLEKHEISMSQNPFRQTVEAYKKFPYVKSI